MNWIDKLNNFDENNIVCVGIDPLIGKIDNLGLDLFDWCKLVIDSTSEYCDIYKFQFAYFEEGGIESLSNLKSIIEYIKEKYPEKILIGDSKRADINSTAQAYANSMYDYWGFDVATVNPYFGSDSIIPFSKKNGAIVICKSSNKSSNEIQDKMVGNKYIYEEVIEIVERCNSTNNLGIVVGATYPKELKKIRSGTKLPLLIPGLGFQGGDFKSAIQAAEGGKNILNSSRGICFPNERFESLSDYSESIQKALNQFIRNIKSVSSWSGKIQKLWKR